ncbi:probable ATP-dependent RNA helicase DHX34 isoform X2 [Hydractinia symbiolongicarpus]|uniref:probable ATP-dependent RNA helicase DHX34 isoform X2 n=1 Tax=Hydractinia symbiolongicarpus TaxID=13093 RepID=UPI00254C271E|nr:probable ATP-dependent RNA helicase DHX34 isoform X2 [Hydractinia symbiolongicarpus]
MEKWKNNARLLDNVFFTDNDVIQRHTSEHKDFWLFLEKYENFRSKKKQKEPSTISDHVNKFEFPLTFNRRYKVHFALLSAHIKERYKSFVSKHYERKKDCELSLDEVNEFKQILLYYFDFLQKQKFSKLKKLKHDQNNLPIKQYEESIIYAISGNQVVVVAGDTGCGKSTQVPQYLLSAGYTNIACTQPRRIACISLAKRVGYETLNEYGSDVAYQVRFETSKTKKTKVLFLTEGLLLRQFQSDPALSMYNIVVVDEVHERHINGDFLLGVLKCLLQQRTDLKLVLMSATINIDLFANYFDSAPVIQVPGRLYPIELQYVPHFVEYRSSERGDLLIFMSGMSEISTVVEAAREYTEKTKSWIVLPLHSSLSIEDQDKIFDIAPEGVRKCIVSTNIAETSITIDGVRFIADSGKVKEMNYDPQVKMQRLQEFWISQASAEQRKGRAGRTGPGVCFRLYAESDYSAFSQYSTPEIHRVPLDTLVLQMASLGLRDATLFPFIEPPPKSSLVNASYFLKQQKALTAQGDLTPIGQMLARLPVDIVIGKMLIMGSLFNMVDPVLVIAAALSVQSPLTRKFGGDAETDVEHRRKELFSPHGDPFTLLNAYDEWILVKSDRRSSSRKWCKRRGLEEQRFYEISKLKRQFEELLKDHGLLQHRDESRKRSDDRTQRQHLLKLKREHKSQSTRKRKLLKLQTYGTENNDGSSSEAEEAGIDIHDIDFKLRHNLSKLEATSKENRRFTYRDINLLKLVVSSGLYPQVVVADELNISRKQTEQVFHSKDKQFLMLHPTGVYTLRPDFLESLYSGQENSKETTTERRFADTKEFLIYVSLLETNKPYVVNTMKVPALQTLFLLSSSIDTNSNCTQFVFDGWIELTFDEEYATKMLMTNVVQLRKAWDALLEQKLSIYNDNEEVDESELRVTLRKIGELERVVSLKLAEFIDADIPYKLRRISSAEIKVMYVGCNVTDNIQPSDKHSIEISTSENENTNPLKGGTNVTSYLTYGCLRDDMSVAVATGQAEYLVEHYHCPKCKEHLICTLIQRIQHDEICGITLNSGVKEDLVENEKTTVIPAETVGKTPYFCEGCNSEFLFSTTEILKHKLTHKSC